VNLFSVVEGLKEENLSTAILRLLLLRSEDIRESFVDLVSRHCSVGLVTIGDQFACIAEHPTTDDSSGSGRVDLVIETANTVIGVENKLFAGFQTGQPEKYLPTLKDHARKLKELRGTSFEHVLVILVPESRKAEVDGKIENCAERKRYILLTWHDTLAAITKAATAVDPTTKTILEAFEHFLLKEKLALIPRFEKLVPHLRSSFESRGTSWQREVVGRLWRFFPDGGARMDSGATWVGFYFCTECDKTKVAAWFGFIPRGEIREDGLYEAQLVVATTFPVAFSAAFRQIMLDKPHFLGKLFEREVRAWAIEYDETWANSHKWQDELRPLTAAVEALPMEPRASHA
jgi:hypothetical protein